MITSTIMFTNELATINVILIVGIVAAVLAARSLQKGNRELHTKNLTMRRRLFGHNES